MAGPQPQRASSTASKQQLSVWGLPAPILEAFHKKGLKQLYPWQAAALNCAAAGNNLVYCAPTSGGKSLVADVLMLTRLHKQQQALQAKAGPARGPKPQQQPVTRALIVLPYLSIVSEKSAHLSKLLESVKWRVKGYKGDDAEGQPLAHPAERVSICSIEKANGALNKMIQEQRLHELVSVTIDEAHMLADPNRGAALEMLLAKLMACRDKASVQVVAMSATMSGLDSLSAWLDAHLFLTNFRPVPLTEHAVFEGAVFAKVDRSQQQMEQSLAGAGEECILQEQRTLEGAGKNDKESLLALVAEVVAESHSVLVFCAGRNAAKSCAEMLSRELPKRLGPPAPAVAAARADLVEQLRIALSGSSDEKFEQLLLAGVAFHHAGLTNQERAVVEQGFSSGALLVLTATSTLAAGVNLPARRVILRSVWQGVGDVSRAQYLQMVGRAGRAGHSAVGEAYLMAKGSPHSNAGEWAKVCQLLAAPLPVLHSQLVQDPPKAVEPPKLSRAQAARAAALAEVQQQREEYQQQQQQQQQLHPGDTQGGISSAVASAASGQLSALSGAAAGGVSSQRGVPQASGSRGRAAGQAGTGAPEVNVGEQPHLQHLLLDALATELVTQDKPGASVQHLLQNTLAFFHIPWDQLSSAAQAALTALRARRLISFAASKAGKPSHWKLTPLGRAVVASALDPGTGLKLYSRLDSLNSCMVLGSNAHLLYVLQTEPAVAIFDWSVWHKLMRQLSPQQRRVAEVEGIDTLYIDRRMSGQPGNAISDEQHGRFAAAVLLDWLVADVNSINTLEKAWGQQNTLTKAGISKGMLQKWQAELSKTAAMAALLASEAGWWQLETLLGPLAAQVAAGARPELLPLMKVQGMQPSHAAALHTAGLGHPDLLLCASEGEVAAALAAGLPPNMRKRKQLYKRGLSVGLTGNPGTNAMVARAARSVLAAAREYAVLSAAEAAASGVVADEDGEQATQAIHAAPALTRALVGQATLHTVRPIKADPLLAKLLDTWQLQSSFALGVVLSQQHCAAPAAAASAAGAGMGSSTGCGRFQCSSRAAQQQQQQAAGAGCACAALHGPVPVALVLSWSDKEAVLLHLPSSTTRGSDSSNSSSRQQVDAGKGSKHSTAQAAAAVGAGGVAAAGATAAGAAGGQDAGQWVWSVIDHLLGDPSRTVTCLGAAQVLAALAAVGVRVRAVVDDAAAAFMLWQPRGLEHAAGAAAAAGGAAGAAAGGGEAGGAEQQGQQRLALGVSTEEASKAAAAVVLAGSFKLQVPLLQGSSGPAATAAAKSVLLSRALMPPLRALLAKQQLTPAYESVEQPLLQAFAEVRAGGVAVSTHDLQQQLRLCEWQAAMLQQQASQLLGHHQLQQLPLQQQQTQPFGAHDGFCSLEDNSIRLLLSQQRLVAVSNERLQQQPLLQLLHLGVRTACKRQQPAALPLLRLLLSHCCIQQYQQQLQQLLQHYAVASAAAADGGGCRADASVGFVVLQPHAALEPVTGQVVAGWAASLNQGDQGCAGGFGEGGLVGLMPVPALPVLISAANLAQQGYTALVGPVTVAAAVQAGFRGQHQHQGQWQQQQQQQQQQQEEEMYVVGKLCSITQLPAAAAQLGHSSSQVLPWQVNDGGAFAAAGSSLQPAVAAAAGGRGGQASAVSSMQQPAAGDVSRLGSVRVWCGGSESVCELQLPTTALFSILRPPGFEQQQPPDAQQQQWQQQQHGGSSSGGCPAFLPGWCSCAHLIHPSSSSNSFIGLQLQQLPLLLLAGLSQDPALLSALAQNPRDPLGAAAAAWLPRSNLPPQLQASLLGNVQSGVLDGVPVAAAAAPGVLLSVTVQALLLGHRPGVQREQLGVGQWPKGTNLVDSLMAAFPGLEAWREKVLADATSSRALKTLLGRRIPFRLPQPEQHANKAAAKQLKEAQRSAVSLLLLSCLGDVQRLVVACMHRACKDWVSSSSSGSSSGGRSGRDATAAGEAAAAGAVRNGSGAGAGAAAAAGAGGASGGGAPGRLMPGCQGGAPSGRAIGAAAATGGGNGEVPAGSLPVPRFVVVSGQQVVLEVPSAAALPLLQRCSQQVGREVAGVLGLLQEGEAGVGGACVKLPFRWWWGGSLDVLQANVFSA